MSRSQADLGEMELQRIICAQADIESSFEKVWERVPLVSQEKSIIAKRAHCDSDLFQIEQILKCWYFSQQNTVRYGVRSQERGGQVVGVPCLSTVRAEDQCVYTSHETSETR